MSSSPTIIDNQLSTIIDDQLSPLDSFIQSKKKIQRYLFHIQSGEFLLIFTGHFLIAPGTSGFLTTEHGVTIYKCRNNHISTTPDHEDHSLVEGIQVQQHRLPSGKLVSVLLNRTIFPQGIYVCLKKSRQQRVYVQSMYQFLVDNQPQYFTLASIDLEMNGKIHVYFNIHASKNSKLSKIEMPIPPHTQAIYALHGQRLRNIFT